MKTLLIAVVAYSFSFIPVSGDSVYICVSTSAKKYHFSKSCHGLQRCTHTIKETTKADAVKLGYTVCLIEKVN